jgi:hypothetical protein
VRHRTPPLDSRTENSALDFISKHRAIELTG